MCFQGIAFNEWKKADSIWHFVWNKNYNIVLNNSYYLHISIYQIVADKYGRVSEGTSFRFNLA